MNLKLKFKENLDILVLSLQPLPPSQCVEWPLITPDLHAMHGLSFAKGWRNRIKIIYQDKTSNQSCFTSNVV